MRIEASNKRTLLESSLAYSAHRLFSPDMVRSRGGVHDLRGAGSVSQQRRDLACEEAGQVAHPLPYPSPYCEQHVEKQGGGGLLLIIDVE